MSPGLAVRAWRGGAGDLSPEPGVGGGGLRTEGGSALAPEPHSLLPGRRILDELCPLFGTQFPLREKVRRLSDSVLQGFNGEMPLLLLSLLLISEKRSRIARGGGRDRPPAGRNGGVRFRTRACALNEEPGARQPPRTLPCPGAA